MREIRLSKIDANYSLVEAGRLWYKTFSNATSVGKLCWRQLTVPSSKLTVNFSHSGPPNGSTTNIATEGTMTDAEHITARAEWWRGKEEGLYLSRMERGIAKGLWKGFWWLEKGLTSKTALGWVFDKSSCTGVWYLRFDAENRMLGRGNWRSRKSEKGEPKWRYQNQLSKLFFCFSMIERTIKLWKKNCYLCFVY